MLPDACTAILVHYSLGCTTLRLSAVCASREPQRTVRSPTPVGHIKPSYLYLDYFLRCRALARVLLGLSHSIYLSAQAPTPAENASPAFPDTPSRLN